MTTSVFNYELYEQFPPLAWLMCLKSGEDCVTVKHGAGVECTDDFFVSGVWAGDFSAGRFDDTAFSCSSGARMNNEWGGVSC